MRSARSGAARRARARLVSGPTPTSHTPSVRAAGVDDEPDGVGAVERAGRCRQVGAVEAAGAVHHRRRVRRLEQRPRGAGVHRHVDAEQVAHDPGVVGRAVERGVAGDRRDAEQVGVAGGDDDRHRVVVAGIAVEDQRDGHGAPPREPSSPRAIGHRRGDRASDRSARSEQDVAGGRGRPGGRPTRPRSSRPSRRRRSTGPTPGGRRRAGTSRSPAPASPSRPCITVYASIVAGPAASSPVGQLAPRAGRRSRPAGSRGGTPRPAARCRRRRTRASWRSRRWPTRGPSRRAAGAGRCTTVAMACIT